MTEKKFLITALGSLFLLLPAQAVTVDVDSFGAALNGWRKNRTASYKIDEHPYLTFKPTITPNASGGVFVSTRVEHKKTFGKKTTAYIELNYDSESTLLTVQIKVMANGLRLNSGAIARPPLAPAPSAGAPAAGDAEPWLSPTARMINQLFTALDGEFTKLAKAKQEEKKDVFSRVFGKGYDGADLATALRHNLNLLIGNIR
ncbi:MAG: hypothetical protein ACON4R_07035 [Akkermansiaceae bacterium]